MTCFSDESLQRSEKKRLMLPDDSKDKVSIDLYYTSTAGGALSKWTTARKVKWDDAIPHASTNLRYFNEGPLS